MTHALLYNLLATLAKQSSHTNPTSPCCRLYMCQTHAPHTTYPVTSLSLNTWLAASHPLPFPSRGRDRSGEALLRPFPAQLLALTGRPDFADRSVTVCCGVSDTTLSFLTQGSARSPNSGAHGDCCSRTLVTPLSQARGGIGDQVTVTDLGARARARERERENQAEKRVCVCASCSTTLSRIISINQSIRRSLNPTPRPCFFPRAMLCYARTNEGVSFREASQRESPNNQKHRAVPTSVLSNTPASAHPAGKLPIRSTDGHAPNLGLLQRLDPLYNHTTYSPSVFTTHI